MTIMKRIALYICVIITTCLAACNGMVFEPEEDLEDITRRWSISYVELLLENAFYGNSSDSNMIISVFNDTVSVIYLYKNSDDEDSVNVISNLYQLNDSIVLTTDGYRFSKKYWAHLFTTDSGIINYNGTFHVDFYEIGKTTPWAWGEVRYLKQSKGKYYNSNDYSVKVDWY